MECYLITKELENLSHTLNDLKTTHKTIDFNIKHALEIQKSIEPRIRMLEERIDRITIEVGEMKK